MNQELDGEFEFKPLTEGLGFHRKANAIRSEIENATLAREELSLDLPKSEPSLLRYPREKGFADLVSAFHSEVDFIGDVPAERPKPQLENRTSAPQPVVEPQRLQLIPIAFSFPAMVFDAVMAFALSLLFLIVLVIATDLDMNRLLQATAIYSANQISMIVLYISVAQLYAISARAFAGQTLGEWAFDVQLGSHEDQQRSVFPLLVFVRAIMITATGVFIFPLIAMIFGVDYLAKILGLRFYRLE